MLRNYVRYDNFESVINRIGQKFDEVEGAYVFKGSIAFASLPASLTTAMVGYVYNMNAEFTTDSRFVEGAGKVYPAGTNVAIADVGSAQTPDLKFDVLAGFIDVAAIYNEIDAVAAMIADKFSAQVSYAQGDIVYHEHVLYRFDEAHAAGDWTGTDATSLTVDDMLVELYAAVAAANTRINTTQSDIAPTFDTATSYTAGDLVIYENQLYKFTADHAAGAWTGSDVATTSIAEVVGSGTGSLADRIDDLRDDLAPAFDATQSYAIGDVVMYGDTLYEFTSAHTANDPWDPTEVDDIQVTDIIQPLTTSQVNALLALLDTPTTT